MKQDIKLLENIERRNCILKRDDDRIWKCKLRTYHGGKYVRGMPSMYTQNHSLKLKQKAINNI